MDTKERIDHSNGSLKLLRLIAYTPLPVSLETAVQCGDVDLVRLISGSDDVNITHCVCAIKHGHTEIVRLLLEPERGVDPSANANEALRSAITIGHTEIVRLLLDLPLDRGVNPAAENNSALRSAITIGHTEIVRLILELPLERGVDPAADNNAAL